MILSEEKLALAKDEVLLRIKNTEELSEDSQKDYIKKSISPAKEGEGRKIRVNPLNGIFIAPELHWNLIAKTLGNEYKPKPHPAGEIMETKMDLKNVFPPKTIVRDFPRDPGVESFCKAEIKFKPRLLSKSQAVYRLETVRERANETDDWAKPLKDWLESQEKPGFYYVIEFEIVCEFDFDKYWNARKKGVSDRKRKQEVADFKKEVRAEKADKGEDFETRMENIRKQARAQLKKEAEELAEWAIEYVTKEEVFDDLCNAIDAACEASSQEKESTPRKSETKAIKEKTVENKGPQESALSPKHRILIYKPVNLKLIVDIIQPNSTNNRRGKKEEGRIYLAEKIMAKIEARNYETEQEIVIDKNLKVVIQSEFFEGETKTLEEILSPEFNNWKLHQNKEYRYIKSKEVELHPNFDKITKNYEKMRKYPITFNLVRSVGDSVSGGIVQYCKTVKNIRFDLPIIRFSVTSPYFPRKGEQFDVKFYVTCESNSSLDYTIPVRVDCHLGKNFSTVTKSDTESISYNLDIEVKQTGGGTKGNIDNKRSNTAKFVLMAEKASFPGYYNSAYFEFYVGEHNTAVETWRLNITVLPNLLDTLVVGGTGLLAILSVAYPDIFPAITQGLSIANLEIIPATIYLGYRVLNWSRKTSGTQ